MAHIHRLPPELANQIAAGEVVERPASVVKELVENALDAGAHRIAIITEQGGKKVVRVEDDGQGMGAADARLALERHATSKIGRAEDLAAITTLGFRGEALPSIASVSHLTLRTRARGTMSGTEIRVNAGTVASSREIGVPEGTFVEVADLFYNLPARRKFLKADHAEAAQITRVVTQLALAHPGVGFTLTNASRQVIECPPAATLAARFFQLYGERPDLVELRRESGGMRLGGYIAALAEQGPVRGPQNVFVNGRIVRDRTIAHAIIEAYSTATVKQRSPEVHLFLDVPSDRVDVNVHPTKAEVRFLDQGLVHEILRRALADALGRGPAPQLQFQAVTGAVPEPVPRTIPGVFTLPAQSWPGGSLQPPAELGISGPAGDAAMATGSVAVASAGTRAEVDVPPMVPLGQFRDTFIIAVDRDGVAIIDQHVAHERVLFEQVMERLMGGQLESQRLLEPLLLELSPARRAAIEQHRDALEHFGFDMEEFGGDAVRIAAAPALLGPEAAATAVRALVDDLEELDREAGVKEALRCIAATTACHAAVKANQPLTLDKMRHILDELRRTAYSTVCPHGRPVVLRLTRREIERNFERI